jgi:hypothetical protein
MKNIEKLANHGEWCMNYCANEMVKNIIEIVASPQDRNIKTEILYWRTQKQRMLDMGLDVTSYDNKIAEVTKNYNSLPYYSWGNQIK